MLPTRGKRLYISLAAAGLLTLGGAGVATASHLPFGHGDGATVNAACANDSADPAATDGETQDDTQGDCEAGAEDAQGQPGTLDDGQELLPQATLSVEQAIAAAQSAATGAVARSTWSTTTAGSSSTSISATRTSRSTPPTAPCWAWARSAGS